MDEDLTSLENAGLHAELQSRLRFETLIAELSSEFINLPAAEVDGEIMEAERRLCEFLDLDISAIWQLSATPPGPLTLTHYYSAQDGPQPSMQLSDDDFPWFRRQMLAGRVVAISSLDELPAEADHDLEVCRQLGVKSTLCIPLVVGGERPVGVLGLNTTRAERDWPEALVKRLQLVAQVFTNALARKRTEEALRRTESLLTAGADLAGLGCYEVDYSEPSCFVDERFHDICGIAAGRQPGLQPLQDWVEHMHTDDRPRVLDVRRELHEDKIEQISTEYRYLHPIKGQRWLHHIARVAARNEDGHTLRSYGVVRDITDHKETENEARELRDSLAHLARVNTLGAMSGALAHELNQPLGIILSNAQAAQELLAQDPPDLTEVQDILADIIAADRRAGEIIGRLRELLKRGEVSLRPHLLNEVIEEVLDIANSDLIGRGVTVVRDLAAKMPPIAGDRVQLLQLVLNLVVNGADAMASAAPGMRRLHLQTRLQHGLVQASVRDEGAGLPADPDRLFQPFYSTKPQGLGLGLPICQAIVAAHHGRLWAEPHSDRGSVFCFELPIAGSSVNP